MSGRKSERHSAADLSSLRPGIGSRFRIGVGRADWSRLPLPPNRTGGFPASGSPVDGLTFMRVDRPKHGRSPDCTAPVRRRRCCASVIQAKPLASFHSRDESRQQARCPDTRFGHLPQRVESGRSGLLSQRHCRRCVFRLSGHCAFHLPASLRSPGVTRLRRYYGRSDSCPAAPCLAARFRSARTGLFAS